MQIRSSTRADKSGKSRLAGSDPFVDTSAFDKGESQEKNFPGDWKEPRNLAEQFHREVFLTFVQ